MSGNKGHSYSYTGSKTKEEQDAELAEVLARSSATQERVLAISEDFRRLTRDVASWAERSGIDASLEALVLRLVLLSPVLHETTMGEKQPHAIEYQQLEGKAIALKLRALAAEWDVKAIHEDMHRWAETYGVELLEETRISQISPSDFGMFADDIETCFDKVPPGKVVNSDGCEAVPGDSTKWNLVCKFCGPKLPDPKPEDPVPA